MSEIIDLSQEIYQGMPVYAGHLETAVWQHHTPSDGAEFRERFLVSEPRPDDVRPWPDARRCDQPLDPRDGAPRIDQMPLDKFCGEGTCLDVSDVAPREYITADRLERALPHRRSSGGGRCSALARRHGRSLRRHRRSTRPSTRGWTRRRPTGCRSTTRRSSAWTPPVRTTRSTSDLPRSHVLPARGRDPLREPRQPGGAARPAVHGSSASRCASAAATAHRCGRLRS